MNANCVKRAERCENVKDTRLRAPMGAKRDDTTEFGCLCPQCVVRRQNGVSDFCGLSVTRGGLRRWTRGAGL